MPAGVEPFRKKGAAGEVVGSRDAACRKAERSRTSAKLALETVLAVRRNGSAGMLLPQLVIADPGRSVRVASGHGSQSMTEQILELTPLAVEKVLAARAEEGLGSDHGLRLSVTKGGCSGYEYSVKFAEKPNEGDLMFEVAGLSVFVDPDSEPLLRGTVLDYVDGLSGAGLRFLNPNAAHECGCGSSFAAPQD